MAVTKRAYNSPIREQQAQLTRLTVLDAAARCFLAAGYTRTTMSDIADRAGVSVQTVQLLGSKSSLLLAAVERAVSDTATDSASPSGHEFRDTLAPRRNKQQKLALMKTFILQRMPEAAPILRVFRDAASTDKAIARAWTEHEERRYADVTAFVSSCESMLRSGITVKHAADIVWSALVSPQVGDMFIHGRGWSVDDYVDWVADTFDRLLLR